MSSVWSKSKLRNVEQKINANREIKNQRFNFQFAWKQYQLSCSNKRQKAKGEDEDKKRFKGKFIIMDAISFSFSILFHRKFACDI